MPQQALPAHELERQRAIREERRRRHRRRRERERESRHVTQTSSRSRSRSGTNGGDTEHNISSEASSEARVGSSDSPSAAASLPTRTQSRTASASGLSQDGANDTLLAPRTAPLVSSLPRDNAERRARARNALRSQLSTVLALNKLSKKRHYAFVLYLVPITIALLTVLLADTNAERARQQSPDDSFVDNDPAASGTWDFAGCGALRYWASSHLALMLVLIGLNVRIISSHPPSWLPTAERATRLRQLRAYHRANSILLWIFLVWCVVGAVATFSSTSCEDSFLYQLSVTLYVIEFVILSLVVCFVTCSAALLYSRFGPLLDVESGAGNQPMGRGAAEERIRDLRVQVFDPNSQDAATVEMLAEGDALCAICLDDYILGDEVRWLPCRHHFHAHCVDQWLLGNKTCPFCKHEIDATDGLESLGRFRAAAES